MLQDQELREDQRDRDGDADLIERRPIAQTRPPAAPAGTGAKRKIVRLAGVIVALAALAGGAMWGQYWWTQGRYLVSTDDAYVGARNATLSPKVSGYITEIAVVVTDYRLAELATGEWRVRARPERITAEAAALSGVAIRSPADLERAAARLRRRIGGGALAVTRGADGMTLFEGDDPGVAVATARREVFDVQGAGDTAIAALALAKLAGGTLQEAALIANAAAGVVVGKVGTATASPSEITAQLPRSLAAARRTEVRR